MKYEITPVNEVQKASKVRPPAKRTELVVVMDKSGSMARHQMTVLYGYNEFMKNQKDSLGECNITLVQFNSRVGFVKTSENIAQSKELTTMDFRPSGQTALYDAVGKSIDTMSMHLKSRLVHDFVPTQVIFFIMTDGKENASCKFNLHEVARMIREKTEKFGWLFYFFGATKEAFVEGQKMGIRPDKLKCEGNFEITYQEINKIAKSHRIEYHGAKGTTNAIEL